MAISRKYKRNILCDGKKYVWCVYPDEDFEDRLVLNIVSEDKQYILACPIANPFNYVISKGCKFQGKTESGIWKRYLYPQEIPDIITPKVISEIVRWAVSGDTANEISYNGCEIWL